MSEPAKFLFDTVFENAALTADSAQSAEEAERALLEEEMEAARQRAFEEGFEAGKDDAIGQIEAQISKSMETILASFNQATQKFNGRIDQGHSEAVKIAASVANKLCGEMNDREPLHGLIPFLENSLKEIRTEPILEIFVCEDVVAEVEARMAFVSSAAGFTGAVSIKGREGLSPQDAVIEWQDGRVAYSPSKLNNYIDELVAAYASDLASGGNGVNAPQSSGEHHE